MDLETSNIWKQLTKLQKPTQQIGIASTIIVLGQSAAGKTSLLKLLKNDFDFECKPTHLLDYFYLRKPNLIHCYELAYPALASILKSILVDSKNGLKSLPLFVLAVDLTDCKHSFTSVNALLAALRKVWGQFVSQITDKKYKQWLIKRKQTGDELGFPVIIVGTKYDVFEKLDLQSRKWTGRALCYTAIKNKCSLIYTSTRLPQLGLDLRTFVFESLHKFKCEYAGQLLPEPKYTICRDLLKSVLIQHDSISDLGLPSQGTSAQEAICSRLWNLQQSHCDEEGFVRGERGDSRLQEAIWREREKNEKLLAHQVRLL